MASNDEIRETLFGDLPLNAWPPRWKTSLSDDPWRSFLSAREAADAGRRPDAISLWQEILAMPNLESLHYAQAWHFLRSYGVHPDPSVAKDLLGVVLEVPMEGGLDVLAAYADHHAAYFNFNGSATLWLRPDQSLDPLIDSVLYEGAQIIQRIGVWKEPRRPAPALGDIRINLISPAGLHFGEGPMKLATENPMTKPIWVASTALLQEIVRVGLSSLSKEASTKNPTRTD